MKKLLLLMSTVIGSLFATAAPVAASCVEAPPLPDAIAASGVTFVGTVISTKDDGRTATFTVEEIWRGPQLPGVVEVRGGAMVEAISSVDRTWQIGQRYIVVGGFDNGRIVDNACSATREWAADLAVHRPANVQGPTGSVPQGGDQGPLAGIGPVALAAAAVGGVGLLVFGAVLLGARRRRTA